jgi:hypothetical protein
MSKENKIVITVVALSTILILVLGIAFANKTQPPDLEASGDAKAEILGAMAHNWGRIDIDGGNVEKVFEVKNSGRTDLEITNFKTSCMCTEAQVTIDDDKSPIFGMHTRSGWKGVVKPGKTAEIKVVFDPMFHGPQGTGPVTRIVSFDTNDSNNQTVELRLTGNVVKVNN